MFWGGIALKQHLSHFSFTMLCKNTWFWSLRSYIDAWFSALHRCGRSLWKLLTCFHTLYTSYGCLKIQLIAFTNYARTYHRRVTHPMSIFEEHDFGILAWIFQVPKSCQNAWFWSLRIYIDACFSSLNRCGRCLWRLLTCFHTLYITQVGKQGGGLR